MKSEEELLSYVDDGTFSRDFDFTINTSFGRELKVEPDPVSLASLVIGFSSWQSFSEAVVKKGNEGGPRSATCMVILYAFDYIPSPRINTNARLIYLGAFDFS